MGSVKLLGGRCGCVSVATLMPCELFGLFCGFLVVCVCVCVCGRAYECWHWHNLSEGFDESVVQIGGLSKLV